MVNCGTNNAQQVNYDALVNDTTSNEFVEKLIVLAWKNYPLNEVSQRRIHSTEESLFQSKWSWLNTFSLSYQYTPNITSDQSTQLVYPRAGIGVTVNIGNIFSVPSKIAQADEDYKIAIANYNAQKVFIRAEIIRRYADYKRDIELLKVRTQAVEDSYSSLLLTKKKFDNGEIDLDEYNKVLRSYTDNMERKVVSDGDLMYHKGTLEEMIGIKLEQVK